MTHGELDLFEAGAELAGGGVDARPVLRIGRDEVRAWHDPSGAHLEGRPARNVEGEYLSRAVKGRLVTLAVFVELLIRVAPGDVSVHVAVGSYGPALAQQRVQRAPHRPPAHDVSELRDQREDLVVQETEKNWR